MKVKSENSKKRITFISFSLTPITLLYNYNFIFFNFIGLVVNLACRGDYNVFPNQIKCRRKTPGDSQLEWSHIPVCYPSVLVSKTHWTKTLHARSVSCTGDASKTTCYLSCIRDYIAVESKAYSCSKHEQPCNAWTLGDAQCFICDQQCASLHQVDNPR